MARYCRKNYGKKLRTEIENQSAQKSQSKSYTHKGRSEEKVYVRTKKTQKILSPKDIKNCHSKPVS